MEKQRIIFIDYIKAFSITLIIVSHCIGWFPVNDVVNIAIKSIHVPIFFIAIGVLKGYLQKELKIGTFVKKRSLQLLIPYFWFSIYNSAIKLCMMALGIGGGITSQVLKEEAIAFFITGNGTVWFLMTLFLAETLFIWLKSFKQNWLLVVTAIALGIIPFFFSSVNPFVMVLNRLSSAFSYIVLGYYLAGFIKKGKVIILVGLLLLSTWFVLVYNSSWDYTFFGSRFNNILPTIATIICGSVGFIMLFSLFRKAYSWFEYIGKNSLILMLMHPTFLLIGIYGVYPHLKLHGDLQFVLFSIVMAIGVLGLSLLCVPIIHRYFPFVIGEIRNKEK